MKNLQDCLSTLSIVATCTAAVNAGAKGRAAVDAYVEQAPDTCEGRLRALRELYRGYINMHLDSAAAHEIQKDIELRIVELEVERLKGAPN